jgi:hypothetical protein
MNNLQRFAGIAALFEAIIYISAFIFFGALWDFPSDGSIQQKFTFLTENQVIFTVVNLLMYIVFGLLLAVLVLGLHQRLKGYSETLSNLAAIFGIIWVALVVASGMVANIGLNTVLQLSLTDPEQAMTIWLTINTIVEGIGGGNELVGGLWVVIISYSSLKANVFPKLFTYFGLFVGFTGIATIYPEEILTAIFGLSQIIWFIFLGVLMLIRTPK